MRPLLIAAAAALAVAACGGAASGGSTSTAATPATGASGTTVRLVDFSLQPATVSVATRSTIDVVNAGKSPHNLWIRDASGQVVAKTSDLAPGQHASLKLDLAPGAYTDYCGEPGHESLGMKGTLTLS